MMRFFKHKPSRNGFFFARVVSLVFLKGKNAAWECNRKLVDKLKRVVE